MDISSLILPTSPEVQSRSDEIQVTRPILQQTASSTTSCNYMTSVWTSPSSDFYEKFSDSKFRECNQQRSGSAPATMSQPLVHFQEQRRNSTAHYDHHHQTNVHPQQPIHHEFFVPRTTPRVGKYECSFEGCHKRFHRKHHLESHLVSHSPEKPFVCNIPECSMAFRRPHELKRHVASKHASKS